MPRVVNAESLDLRAVSAELKNLAPGEPIRLERASHLHGLCGGLKSAEVTIDGDGGDYLGVLNDGATIRVHGNVGRYLADNMTRGRVIVDGSAGYGVGAYCYGGTIVVHGDAGDFAAVMNKGANILIGGNVGDEVATYMLAGDLIIVGNAGKGLGNYLIRGNIYIGGTWDSLGHNTLLADLDAADLVKLQAYFHEYGIQADPARFRKIVRLSEKPFYKAKEAALPEQPKRVQVPIQVKEKSHVAR